MITALKWILAILLAGLTWVVVQVTIEYYRPYRRITMGGRHH
jgi:hypothetical protein